MKQLFVYLRSGELVLAEVPEPARELRSVLMLTRASFVSAGTERMMVDVATANDLWSRLKDLPRRLGRVVEVYQDEGFSGVFAKTQTRLIGNETPDQPLPIGYSCAGVLTDVGAEVRGLAVGDRVACCGAGYANHAEHNRVPRNLVVRLPDAVSFQDGASAAIGGIALQSVRQAEARIGEGLAVIGLGLIGLLTVQILKAAGCRVLAFDPAPERCRLAYELGADRAVSRDLVREALDFSRGHGLDTSIIAAGTPSNEPLESAAFITRAKGKVVIAGLVGMQVPRHEFYRKELDLRLSTSYGPGRYDAEYEEFGNDYPYAHVRWTEQRNIEAYLRLVAEGRVKVAALISHQFDFDKALDAYRLLKGDNAEPPLGIVLNYAGPSLATEEESAPAVRSICRAEPADRAPANIRSESLVIGIVGCGMHCTGILLPILRDMKHVRLKSVSNRSGQSALDVTRRFQGLTAVGTPLELIGDPEINTVFITSRHDSHAGLVCAVLRAGKHVFVEKPLAIRPAELDEIVDLYVSLPQRPVLMVGFNRRFSPHARLARDYLGERSAPLVMQYRVNAGYLPDDHWTRDPRVGGGRVIGEACHFIDFGSAISGALPVDVVASAVAEGASAAGGDDNLSMDLRLSDGSLLNVLYTSSGARQLSKERCEMFVNRSSVILDDYRHTQCLGELGSRELHDEQDKGFRAELHALVEGIRGAGNPIPFSSLVATTRATFSAEESLRTGRRVTIQPVENGSPG